MQPARVQRPHGTALIGCHLPEHKPPVGSRMTKRRVNHSANSGGLQ